MSTGSISLDILLNKILTDAISGGNESIRAIQKRYPSLSEKEAHEILAMVSATAQSNDDSAELVVTAPPSFAFPFFFFLSHYKQERKYTVNS